VLDDLNREIYPQLLASVTAALEDMIAVIPGTRLLPFASRLTPLFLKCGVCRGISVMLSAHLLLGQCYLIHGRSGDSLKHLQRCLELDPEHATVRKLLDQHHGIGTIETKSSVSSIPPPSSSPTATAASAALTSSGRPRTSSPEPPRTSPTASSSSSSSMISPPPAPRSSAGIQSPHDTIPPESFSLESMHDELSKPPMPWQTTTTTGPGPGARKVGGLFVAIPDNSAKIEAELTAKSSTATTQSATKDGPIDLKKRAAEQAAEEEKERAAFEKKEEDRRETEAKLLRDRMSAQMRANDERRQRDENNRREIEEQARRDRDAAELLRQQHDAEMSFAREEQQRKLLLDQARQREDDRRKLQLEAAERAAAELRRAEAERQAMLASNAAASPAHRFGVAASNPLPAFARVSDGSVDNGTGSGRKFSTSSNADSAAAAAAVARAISPTTRSLPAAAGLIDSDDDMDSDDDEEERQMTRRTGPVSTTTLSSAATTTAPAARMSAAPSRLGVSRTGARGGDVDDNNLQVRSNGHKHNRSNASFSEPASGSAPTVILMHTDIDIHRHITTTSNHILHAT
jgi:hypothetical protein